MSARNGDKARFGKQKKRKMAQRLRVRALREDLKATAAAKPEHQTHPEPVAS